jgi:hypothetical protein
MRSVGMRCSTSYGRELVGGLERIGDAEHVVALLLRSDVSLANLGAFMVDELAAMGIGQAASGGLPLLSHFRLPRHAPLTSNSPACTAPGHFVSMLGTVGAT